MAEQKKDYTQLAQDIIANVGSKENISSLRHCITRLRFVLKDEGQANTDVLKAMDGVVTVVKGGGEYMVVIGNHVADVYEFVLKELGMASEGGGAATVDGEKSEKPQGNLFMRVLNIIMGAMGPTLNCLCAAGIMQGLLTVLGMLGLPGDSGLYTLLNGMGQAFMFFLPISLGYNLAKSLNADDPFLGFIIGAILCYPALNGADITIFGYTVNATYTSTFLPVVVITALAVPLARMINKFIPKLMRSFLTPVLTLFIIMPLGYMFIGPAANAVGNGINIALSGLLGFAPVIAGALIGGLWQILVLFGIHSALISFGFANLIAGNPTQLIAVIAYVCLAQSGVVLAIFLKTKDEKLKGIALPAFISGLFGVTEPAIYGVTLPRIKMFVFSCIGGAVGGAYVMLANITQYQYTGLGVWAALGMLNPESPNILPIIIAIILPAVVGFLLAFFTYKDENPVESKENAPALEPVRLTSSVQQPVTIAASAKGTVLKMDEVPDPVFSQGVLGLCCGIEPVEGKVYAPVDGEVTQVADSKHAFGFTSIDEVEILIHVGVDTVDMNGDGFVPKVQVGDTVKKGQLILTMDMDKIKAAGHPSTVITVVTNSDDFSNVDLVGAGDVEVGADLFKISK